MTQRRLADSLSACILPKSVQQFYHATEIGNAFSA